MPIETVFVNPVTFYAATTDESTQHLVAIIQAFKQCHPSYPNTKIFIIDKDFTEMAVLKEEFPNATILFCQFHVIECFYKAVSDHEVPKERRNALRNVLHDTMYSEHMDDYVDYLAEIVRLGNLNFEKYFLTTGIVVRICGFLLSETPAYILVIQQATGSNIVTLN